MGLTCAEIKTEIWISFSSYYKKRMHVATTKMLSYEFLSGWGLELLKLTLYIYIYICVCVCVCAYACVCVKIWKFEKKNKKKTNHIQLIHWFMNNMQMFRATIKKKSPGGCYDVMSCQPQNYFQININIHALVVSVELWSIWGYLVSYC